MSGLVQLQDSPGRTDGQSAGHREGGAVSQAVGRRSATAVLTVVLLTVAACAAAAPGDLAGVFPVIVLDTADPAALSDGLTVLDASPSELQSLPPDAHALVWLGGYDAATCRFAADDAEVAGWFARYALAGDPRVFGYFVADEPNADHRCPAAPEQVRRRSALVRSLDPDRSRFTLANIDDPQQFAAFRDSVDVLSTDPYPCAAGAPDCDWSLIPSYVAALRAADVTRYMAMVQAFSGGDWRWPTPVELRRMLDQWRASDWCGALVFSWAYQGARLADHPELRSVLRDFGARPPVPHPGCLAS
jgi:hypothetical protein